MNLDKTQSEVMLEIFRSEIRWYHFVTPEARNIVTDRVRTDAVRELADAGRVDIGAAEPGSYSVPSLIRDMTGPGSTSPTVVLGASLGEVPHPSVHCDRDGEPHLGPCVEPGSTSPESGRSIRPLPEGLHGDDSDIHPDAGELWIPATSPEPGRPCNLADWCVVTGPHDAYGCSLSTSPEPAPAAPAEEVSCRCTDAVADAACRTHGVLAFLSGLEGFAGPATKDGTG